MNSTHATHLSSAFLIAAKRSAETRIIDERFEAALVPAIVCAAFSIELGLKSLIYKESTVECKKEHKLGALFEKTSPSTQNEIAKIINIPLADLANKINLVSNAFVDWRYVYEKTSMSIDLGFLTTLAAAVESVNKQIK
ncbi:hypothetical protein [Azotobacter beijerinckii]|uniref:hypothetical protein n=1 Tax=Azotobacter beijerinckii TaxID=170623 RepID=UPI001113E552|nr:hypothetical protein [Azotobacter beijerinckii]